MCEDKKNGHAEKIGSEILLTAKGKIDQEKAILKKEQERQDNKDDDDGGGDSGC